MLSSLSLADRSSLMNISQHSSSGASPLPTTITHSSSVAAPRQVSSQALLQNTATTTPSFSGSFRRNPDQHDLVSDGKENVSPPHPNKLATETSSGSSSHAGDGSSVVFPEKQLVNIKSSDAPSPSTQELLRQQELQLRVLQEQVSANNNVMLFLLPIL